MTSLERICSVLRDAGVDYAMISRTFARWGGYEGRTGSTSRADVFGRYLARCRELSAMDIVRFLDDFKRIHGQVESRSRLISLKVPEPLLAAFKVEARLRGVPYQTQIKNLMRQWLQAAEARPDE